MSSEAGYFREVAACTNAVREKAFIARIGDSEPVEIVQNSSEELKGRTEFVPPILEISDELLLKQISDGDEEALGLLFRRYARKVRNVAYRILRNEAEADDLVQEVFLFIYRKAALFDAMHWLARSWIIHLTYHRAFDRRRYLNSRRFYSSQELDDTAFRLADSREELPFHERSIEGILGKPLMARFNARLSAEQRETIQLYFFEGYALKEIAQLTGRPLANVRGHYYRGLEQMRKYVLPNKMRSK
jgi:RNA polymerase sigma-70 factor (ECF subfamily)